MAKKLVCRDEAHGLYCNRVWRRDRGRGPGLICIGLDSPYRQTLLEPGMYVDKPRIAVITFTDDRDVGLYSKDVENHIRKRQSGLKAFLANRDVEVIDPLDEIRGKHELPYGIRNLRDIDRALAILLGQNIDGIVIGSWNWSPPMLIMDFV